jgi:hypothetical protein
MVMLKKLEEWNVGTMEGRESRKKTWRKGDSGHGSIGSP